MFNQPADFAETVETLREKLRVSNEAHGIAKLALIEERKVVESVQLELNQAVTSLRWWAVMYLIWMVRESLEPARFAFAYPSSWIFKLAEMHSHREFGIAWFTVAGTLIIPLIVTLSFVPKSKACERAQDLALVGLGMGAIGFAYLFTLASRLDIPHVADSYVGSATMMAVTALLVACWHNSRVVRCYLASEGKEPRCAEPVL